MNKEKTDITELFGALTQLKVVIDAMESTSKDVNVPGHDYLIGRFKGLYNDISSDIYKDFTGTLNNLSKMMEEQDDDRH